MLAEAILVHGDIGYKFCWLLPSEDRNQGTPVDWAPINRTYTNWARNQIVPLPGTIEWTRISWYTNWERISDRNRSGPLFPFSSFSSILGWRLQHCSLHHQPFAHTASQRCLPLSFSMVPHWFMPSWCLSWFVSSWCSLIEGLINKIYNLLHHILG